MKLKYLIISIISAFFLTSAISVESSPVVGKLAPKIETKDGKNVVVDANASGKTQVVSFWTPKKPASRIANQRLSKTYGNNSNENVEFISICTDPDEKLMKEVLKVDGVESNNSYSYSEIAPRVFKDYNVEEYPQAFKISADGKIIEVI